MEDLYIAGVFMKNFERVDLYLVFELILANGAIPSSKCFIIAPTE